MQEKIKTEQEQLEEIKMQIRPLDEKSMDLAKKRWMSVAKPLFSLGKLEKAVIQIAGILGTDYYELKKKGLIIMCADNGVVEEGVTQTGQDVTAAVADNFTKGRRVPVLWLRKQMLMSSRLISEWYVMLLLSQNRLIRWRTAQPIWPKDRQ